MDYHQVFISAESEEEASELLRALVKKKLVVGGTIINGPSIFWWKGKITEMSYFYACPFTVSSHQQAIIAEIEKLSNEEVPIVYFIKLNSANEKFLKWIRENTQS